MSFRLPPARPDKPKKTDDVPEWQSWEKGLMDERFKRISIGVAVFGVIMITVIVIMARQRSAEQPKVIRPPALSAAEVPEFPEPFVCDFTSGFRAGQVKVVFRNTGGSRATSVIPRFTFHLMPDHKVGLKEFDVLPKGDCKDRAVGLTGMAPIDPGGSGSAQVQPLSVRMPPVPNTDVLQLYGTSCVYYTGSGGEEHGTCDTYHFKPDIGDVAFQCDGTPGTGKFEPDPISNCAL